MKSSTRVVFGTSLAMAVRFSTLEGDNGTETLGPNVMWIGTHLRTITPEDAHNASPDIPKILEENGVSGPRCSGTRASSRIQVESCTRVAATRVVSVEFEQSGGSETELYDTSRDCQYRK